jgi:hypothetical protein
MDGVGGPPCGLVVPIALIAVMLQRRAAGWFVESLATQLPVIFVIRTVDNPFRSRPSTPLQVSVAL